MPALRAWVLGRFAVEVDGRLLQDSDWRGRRQSSDLLAFLLTRPGHMALTEEVLEGLWADRPLDTARQTLYRSASQLRTLLGRDATSDTGAVILVGSGHVSINPRWPLWLDLTAFQDAVKEAQRTRSEGDCRTALVLYGGTLLPHERYADWPSGRRHEVERERVWLLAQLGEHADARQEMAAALDLGQQLVGLEPWNERAHRRIMRAYAGLGRRAEALRHYHRLAARIEQELGTAPAPETQALFDRLNAEQAQATPVPEAAGLKPPEAALPVGGEGAAAPLGAGQQAPLVGRQQELTLLGGLLADVPPRGSAALIGGEPGIGKTRLAREVCRMAKARGLTVLTGACRAEPDRLPYGSVAQAISGYLRAAGRQPGAVGAPQWSEIAALLAGCEPLWHLVPEYAAHTAPREQLSPDQEQRLIWHAAVTWLGRVAGEKGAVLFLDDLQWADDQTVALLREVLVRLPELPVLVLATYRDDADPASAFGRLLAEIGRQRLALRLVLTRFGQAEVAEQLRNLLGGRPSAELLAAIYDRTNGNPLFVEGLADGLRRSGMLRTGQDELHAPGDLRIPEELAESVRQRTALLAPAARRLLEVVAVAGIHVDHLVLAEASGFIAEELLDALDQLRAARLLVDDGNGYTFHHRLVRGVIYDDLSVGRRMLLHRRVAAALERVTGSNQEELAGTLAHHWSRAGDAPLQAAHYAWRTGERARALGALDQAVYSFNEALAQLDRAGEAGASRRHDVLISLAKAQGMRGENGPAHATLEEALSRAETGEQAAHVYRLLGDIDQRRRAFGQAAQQYQRGLAALGNSASLERGRLLLASAMCSLGNGQHAEANALFEEARVALDAASERRDLGHAAYFAGNSAYYRGALDEARGWLDRSLDLCRRAADTGGQSRALHALGLVFGARGQIGEAAPRFAEALELARRAGYPAEQIGALLGQSSCDGMLGDWAHALGAAEAALEVALQADLTGLVVDCHTRLAEVYAFTANTEAATQQATLALARATGDGEPPAIRVHTVLAAIHCLAGRWEDAISQLRLAIDVGKEIPRSKEYTEAAGLLGVALLGTGDTEGERWLSDALEQCRRSSYVPTACLIQLALAEVCRRRGAHDRAEQALGWARDLAAPLGLPGLVAVMDLLATTGVA